MEEEVGIKVTRLRRRLSVEAEDVKSPSTQSTPTKKRGGRLAAKPQLELIAENAPEAAPKKKTRKSTVKDVAEPVEEKAVTPSRRSTRIRSNTSIVSETPGDLAEVKGTPSRCSTRIRSNTSIVSETPGDLAEEKGTPSRCTTRIKSNTSLIAEPVNVNSPRAKRAARRTSQVGSDNEAPITPARTTRRTRNNSTSSIDKPVEPSVGKLGGEIKEVIVEESENNVNDTKTTDRSKNDSPSLRKSPRLVGKPDRKSSSLDNDNKENEPRSDTKASETPAAADKSLSEPKPGIAELSDQKTSEQINQSVTSKNIIQELEEVPKNDKSIFNKSTTTVEEAQIKTKRKRTKSWTTISVEYPQESSFCSDSETTKKKKKKKNDTLNFLNISGLGDGIMNVSNKIEEADKEQDNVSLNSSTLSNKKKRKQHEMSMTVETETSVHEVSVLNTSVNKSAAKLTVAKDTSEDIKEEGNNLNSSKKINTSGTQKLFEQAPSDIVQSLVFVDDSDSNQEKENKDKKNYSEDQCVSVVDHQLVDNETKNAQINLSYEPMDIDETMPENVSLSNFVDENGSVSEKRKSMNMSQVKNNSINKSKRKSGISDSALDSNINEASTKSPRKSSITDMINDLYSNKTKRKLSITNEIFEDTTDGGFNVSSRKSIVVNTDNHDESINRKANKSKRKSSISNVVTEQNEEDSNNSKRESINADNKSFDEIMNTESNKSKRKSSLSNVIPDESSNETSNKSIRKSSVSDLANDENMDKSINKSKIKSTVTTMVEVSMDKINTSTLADDEDTKNKSSNKSKRKLSILNTNNDSMDTNDKSKNKSAFYLDKTENNETKSTLVLSQLKDLSENEIHVESNVAKDLNEQLSKSLNVPNVNTEKDTDKKNLSLTYSTSTPLQQKSMKKLGLQINTSIIAPNSANKIEKKDTVNKSKKEASIMSEEDGEEDSEEDVEEDSEEDVEEDSEEDVEEDSEEDVVEDSEEDVEENSEEESSLNKSKLINDEAEEVSEDYQSGDSRDEEEREYEKENEIRENGETLDSDEAEFSDDLDYEKDSFIVSSDEEDNDLLSGSGDDLSMSADELTMTAKSKKKFNERKIKEQKKASREMYEARHKLNESDKSEKSPKSKKNHRQRFDTSSSESDEEVTTQQKKNRRQRIDSSHDASALQSDTDKSLSKKKKATLLSESVCDEDETNEKEITIRDKNQADKMDPLTLLNVIKEEPKTPQKGLNYSTVAVTNMNAVEEVNVDENVSIMKANQTSDPLQATIAENDEEDITDEGSISENEEITQNYESVLSNLNKSGKKKVKSSNISLDLNKKTKQTKEPIVGQLNLTQVKKSKKNKANVTKKQHKSLNKSTDKVGKQDDTSEGSSDSIDMKLLFNEDSNNSEVVIRNKEQAGKETTPKEDDEESPGDFIPLKRSLGKTNILENMNISNKSVDESILNVSGKNKNKRKSFQSQETLKMGTTEDDNLDFFIDTTGMFGDENKAEANTSVRNSAKKNKQNNNVYFANREEIPLDGKGTFLKNKANVTENAAETKKQDKSLNKSTDKVGKQDDTSEGSSDSIDMKLLFNEDSNDSEVVIRNKEQAGKETTPKEDDEESPGDFIPLKRSLGKTNILENMNISNKSVDESILNVSGKNKNKRKSFQSQETLKMDNSNDAPLEVSFRSEKNKSKQDLNTSQNNEGKQYVSAVVGTPNQSAKKKKNNKNISQNVAEITVIETDDVREKPVNTSAVNVEGSAKKKKKRLSETQIAQETTDNEDVMNQKLVTKKRKRKSSANQTIDEIMTKDDVNLTNDESITTKNQKKKRKISNNDEDIKTQFEDAVTETLEQQNTSVENIKKKSKVQHQKVNKIDEGATKKNKKRKERDDDDTSKISKVIKQNSFDKVHVPRLPSNILKQLDDKPKTDVVEAKKTKVVSTSEFVVEETKRRRTKPSNYLEESVYCMNDDMNEKKQKRSIKNPKVLPFIPTASTSGSGFTTNFRVNVISQQTKFVAQSSDVSNFKNDYLLKKRIKKLGTFEMYKRQRNIKIAKF